MYIYSGRHYFSLACSNLASMDFLSKLGVEYVDFVKEKHMFGFLCPASISPEGVHSNITDREKYVVQALEGNIEMKMFFAPYNTGGHWILMVICPKDDTIYYLDPLHGKVNTIAKNLIDMSLKLFWVQKGKAKPRKNTRWITVKGPLQPNVVDCGYYMLRYMREIIAVGNTNSIPPTYYNKRKDPYTPKELDQIRVEWMEHFISTLNQEVVATAS